MAGFTTHVNRGPRRIEVVLRFVVALLEHRRMAIGTLAVPVVGEPLPMERIIVIDVLVRLKINPSLPTVLPWPRIPRHGQRLHASPRAFHEILLKRIDAKRVGHTHALLGTIRLLQLDDEILTVPNESPGSFEMSKG